jgi:hypothetical protein
MQAGAKQCMIFHLAVLLNVATLLPLLVLISRWIEPSHGWKSIPIKKPPGSGRTNYTTASPGKFTALQNWCPKYRATTNVALVQIRAFVLKSESQRQDTITSIAQPVVKLQMAKPRIPSLSLLSRFSRTLGPELPFSRSCATSYSSLARRPLRQSTGSCQLSRIANTNRHVHSVSAKRTFSNTPTREYKTVEEAKSRYRSGV